jgi:hypothetical protein
MSVDTSAFVAFLLDRIAEDEANADMRCVPAAALVQLAPGVQVWQTFGTDMPLNDLHGTKAQWVVRTDPGRLHAECDAKRELVRIAEEVGGEVGRSIFRALAEPYAKHRGYADEWRA